MSAFKNKHFLVIYSKRGTSILFYSDLPQEYDDLCESQLYISICAQLSQ